MCNFFVLLYGCTYYPPEGSTEEHYDDVEETFLRIDANVFIDDFSEAGKERFIQEYRDAWALLDSDLPIVE